MWLTDFRRQHGMSIGELGAYIRRLGARRVVPMRVSDILLERLETEPNFRTVPKLADLIAEACGATAQQRDRLVLKRYRGTWKPTGRPRPVATAAAPPPRPAGIRAVVCVDRLGDVVQRFPSGQEAARRFSCTTDTVGRRCRRQVETNEFGTLGLTFRFADEWDRMSPEERRQDLHRTDPKPVAAPKKRDRRGGPRETRMVAVTAITRDGQVLHFPSQTQAARAFNAEISTVNKRIQKDPIRNRFCDGAAFIRTEIWDRMSEEARQGMLQGLGIS